MEYLNQEMLRLDQDLVRQKTKPEINERIDKQIQRNVGFMASQPPEVITERIDELEREWDVDRLLARNAAVLAFGGLSLGSFVNRTWLLLPFTVAGFLWHHMQKGWCPPLPVLRRMGARTRREIDVEKYALKVLRGDFDDVNKTSDPNERTRIALEVVTQSGMKIDDSEHYAQAS